MDRLQLSLCPRLAFRRSVPRRSVPRRPVPRRSRLSRLRAHWTSHWFKHRWFQHRWFKDRWFNDWRFQHRSPAKAQARQETRPTRTRLNPQWAHPRPVRPGATSPQTSNQARAPRRSRQQWLRSNRTCPRFPSLRPRPSPPPSQHPRRLFRLRFTLRETMRCRVLQRNCVQLRRLSQRRPSQLSR